MSSATTTEVLDRRRQLMLNGDGDGFAEEAADREAGRIDPLHRKIGFAAEPPLAGQFECMSERETHADRRQHDAQHVERGLHAIPNDAIAAFVAACSATRSAATAKT